MAYKVNWSPNAISTFDAVIEYLQKKCSSREIKKFITQTEKAIHLISNNPYLFRSSEKRNVHEVLITTQNLLLYRVSSTSKIVELLAFFDTRQNPKKKYSSQK